MGTGWADGVGVLPLCGMPAPRGPEQELCTSSSFGHLSDSCLRQGHLKPWSPGPHPYLGAAGAAGGGSCAERGHGGTCTRDAEALAAGGCLPGHAGHVQFTMETRTVPVRHGSLCCPGQGGQGLFLVILNHRSPPSPRRETRQGVQLVGPQELDGDIEPSSGLCREGAAPLWAVCSLRVSWRRWPPSGRQGEA